MSVGGLWVRVIYALFLIAGLALPSSEAVAGTCLRTDASIKVSGVVARETHYGPPTFGENPQADKKIRIAILRLDRARKLCRAQSTDFGPLPMRIRKAQIINQSGRPLPTDKRVHIFSGVLFQAQNALHFTPLVFVVKKVSNSGIRR